MENFVRIVIIPISIMLAGFLLELMAVQARGIQQGKQKFKVWLRKPDGSLHSDSPCTVDQVREFSRQKNNQIIDINELASFESYSGLSFDLCLAALTADVVSVLKVGQPSINPNTIAWTVAIHILTLVIVTLLVTANQNMSPGIREQATLTRDYGRNWWYPVSKRRTILAILMGLMALTTSFIVLWNVI